MKYLDKTLIIIGRTGSGKSMVAKRISKDFDIPIASFGGYLVSHCQEKGITPSIENLQRIGNEFIKDDSEQFLSNVIEYSIGNSDILIFEGVRHQVIFDLIVSKSRTRSMSIFLEAERETRYRRIIDRGDVKDQNLTPERFVEKESHQVESEIDSLKTCCSLYIDSSPDKSFWLEDLSVKIGCYLIG